MTEARMFALARGFGLADGGDELARIRFVPDDGRELIEARFRLEALVG